MLPSEAYGIIQNNKSAFNGKIQPPFHPKVYSPVSNHTLDNLYQIESDPKEASYNEFKNTSTAHQISPIFEYSDYANEFYSSEDLTNYMRLIRKEMTHKIQILNDPAKFKNRLFNFGLKTQDINNNINHTSYIVETRHHHEESDQKINKLSESPKFITRVNVGKLNKKDENEIVKHEWHNPSKIVFKPFTEAVQEFDMIKDGDRVLVCLSGGKDSMSLLHAIRQYTFVAKSRVFFINSFLSFFTSELK